MLKGKSGMKNTTKCKTFVVGAGLEVTWLIQWPQGGPTLKCSLTMKWPCTVMVLNGCVVPSLGRQNTSMLTETQEAYDVLLHISLIYI